MPSDEKRLFFFLMHGGVKRKRNERSEEKGRIINKEGEPVLHVHLFHPVETQSPAE